MLPTAKLQLLSVNIAFIIQNQLRIHRRIHKAPIVGIRTGSSVYVVTIMRQVDWIAAVTATSETLSERICIGDYMDFWKLATRLDIISALIQRFTVYILIAIAILMGVALMAWSYVSQLPMPAVVVIGLASFAFILWITNTLLGMLGFRIRPLQSKHNDVESQPAKRLFTSEDATRLNLAQNWLRQDREQLFYYITVRPEVNLNTIFSITAPFVEFIFHIESAAVHHLLFGARVNGAITEDGIPLGDTPKVMINAEGIPMTVHLQRGGTGDLGLRQAIVPELRERWIANRLESEMNFNFAGLHISVDVLNPDSGDVVLSRNLQIKSNEVSGRLNRVVDWDWSKYEI